MPLIVINNTSDAWVTIATVFHVVFLEHDLRRHNWLSWDHWQFIWAHVNVWWSFDVKGPKTPPENMLIPSISDQASSEEAYNSDKSVQSSYYLNIFLPPITIPCTSKHRTSLSRKILKSSLGGGSFEICSTIFLNNSLKNKVIFLLRTSYLSIWLTGCCTSQPGSVTLWCCLLTK